MNGTLWVVATPIGNLDDFSTRAVEVLRGVERVYAEDTRRFGKLAARYGITTDAKSCFEANEQARVAEILDYLKQGKDIALVSEAGTPCISDPGFRIVSACRDESCKVSPVPGASAAIAALSVSGFETDKFFFSGFLPQKSGRRERALTEALEFPAATIFYESPHRILKTLDKLQSLSPSRDIFIAREITKLHEECIRGSAKDVFEQFRSRPSIKGEFVLIVRGDGKGKPKTQQAESRGELP